MLHPLRARAAVERCTNTTHAQTYDGQCDFMKENKAMTKLAVEQTSYPDQIMVPLQDGDSYETDTPPKKRHEPQKCLYCLVSPGQHNTRNLENELRWADTEVDIEPFHTLVSKLTVLAKYPILRLYLALIIVVASSSVVVCIQLRNGTLVIGHFIYDVTFNCIYPLMQKVFELFYRFAIFVVSLFVLLALCGFNLFVDVALGLAGTNRVCIPKIRSD